jgi:hypothetical protein
MVDTGSKEVATVGWVLRLFQVQQDQLENFNKDELIHAKARFIQDQRLKKLEKEIQELATKYDDCTELCEAMFKAQKRESAWLLVVTGACTMLGFLFLFI